MVVKGISFELDVNGDLVVDTNAAGNPTVLLIESHEEVAQSLRIRLSTILGEDVLNPAYGLQFRSILGTLNEALAEDLIRSTCLQDNRVQSVDGVVLELNSQKRNLEASVSVTLNDATPLTIQEIFSV